MTTAIKQAIDQIYALIQSGGADGIADDDYICGLQAALDIVYDANASKPDNGFEEAQRLMLAALEEKRDALFAKLGMQMATRPIILVSEGAPPAETPEQQMIVTASRAALHAVMRMESIVAMLATKDDDGKRLTYSTPAPLRHIESLAVHAWLTGFQAGKNISMRNIQEAVGCDDDDVMTALTAAVHSIDRAKPPAKVEILRALNLVTQFLNDPLK